MSRDEDKLIRQLSLLSFLLSHPRPCTACEVQESVEGYAEMTDETFARRFYADRADLAKVGIDIQVLDGAEMTTADEAQVYFLPQGDFRLPAVEFSPAERRALSFALAALDGRFAYARPLRLALMSILRGRAASGPPELERLPVALAPDEDARRAGKQLSRLEDAVTRGKTVVFSYPAADGTVTERTLDPYSLFLIQGRWYVVGRDHLRAAIRTFRLGRINGTVRFVSEKSRDFSIPADYDPDAYGARPPWLLGPVRGEAVVRVGEDLAWWVKRMEPHVRWLGDDEGCSRFAVPFADEQVLLSWITGLGGCGELLEPTVMRDRLKGLLEAMSLAHAGHPEETAASAEQGEAATRTRPHAGAAGAAEPGAAKAEQPVEPASARPSAEPPEETRDPIEPIAPEHLARAMALLYYLVDEQRPAFVAWKTLKSDLGLTRAEVETDLALINLVNFGGGTYALMAEAGPQGIHVVRDVMADVFSEPARLSPVMARALMLALDLLGDTLALDGLESLASVREKVRALVGDGLSEGSVVVEEVVPPDPQVVEVLNHAIRDHRVVEIAYYTTARQELSDRLVEPYLLFHSPDGWYLEAYCCKAEGQRTFKLERIRTARAADSGFTPRLEMDLTRRRTGQAFLPSDVATWATVRFHPRWRTYLEEQGLEHVPGPGDTLRVRMPYLEERWLAQEIIRYLGDAELEHPLSVRRRVKEYAETLAGRYRRPLSLDQSATVQEGDG